MNLRPRHDRSIVRRFDEASSERVDAVDYPSMREGDVLTIEEQSL
jgi:hypothetical protein